MDHYQISHESITSGVRNLFANLERDYPEAENQGTLALCREAVENFCKTPAPKNHDDLLRISQQQTMVVMVINNAANNLRRLKMWGR